MMSDLNFMLEYSNTSWEYEKRYIRAFTLLDTSEKLYRFMQRFEHIDDDADFDVITFE